MCEEKKKISVDEETQLIFSALDKQIIEFYHRWKIYEQLFGSGQENIDLLNKSGSNVFFLFQKMVLDDIFLILSRITDPAQQGKNENASLYNLVNRIENQIPNSYDLKLRKQLGELKKVCQNITVHRRKRLAHADINHALKATAEWLPPVTFGEIEDALSRVRKLMGDIMLLIFESSTSLYSGYDIPMPSGHDGEKLLSLLREAHEAN